MKFVEELKKATASLRLTSHSGIASLVTVIVLLVTEYYMGNQNYSPPWGLLRFTSVNFAGLLIFPALVVLLLYGEKLRDYGFRLPPIRSWIIPFSIVFIMILTTSTLQILDPAARAYYPTYKDALTSMQGFLLLEGCFFVILIGWEFLFRGFLLFSLNKDLGQFAIVIQMVPYALTHAGGPFLESFESIFVGLALGWLAYKTKSIWPCIFVHFAVSIIFDLLVILT